MDRAGRLVPRPRKVLPQGVADLDRGGIADALVRHPAERARPIDLLSPGRRQGTLGTRRHTLCQRLVQPPLARRVRDPRHLTRQLRPQGHPPVPPVTWPLSIKLGVSVHVVNERPPCQATPMPPIIVAHMCPLKRLPSDRSGWAVWAPRLAFPAPALLQARGPPTPVGIWAARHEQRCKFLPASHRRGSLQVEGLRHRLTGHGQRPGQAPGMPGRLCPGRSRLRWAGLPIGGMGEEGSNHRGDARGMQEGCHRPGPLGLHWVQARYGCVQADAQVHLPADPAEVGHLPGADAGRELRQEDAVPLGRVDADEAAIQRGLSTTLSLTCKRLICRARRFGRPRGRSLTN
jgi:hypothetical protein